MAGFEDLRGLTHSRQLKYTGCYQYVLQMFVEFNKFLNPIITVIRDQACSFVKKLVGKFVPIT